MTGATNSQTSSMKKKPVNLPQVPVGIVVSVGKESTEPPRFSAYIWGPAPETTEDATKDAIKDAIKAA